MINENAYFSSNDPFDLGRFIRAQEDVYATVLTELWSGRKRTHWMWFIFPQLEGLGFSPISKHFALKNLEEAQHYFNHPVLGARLVECSNIVDALQGYALADIFGYPDNLKFMSSMTLFAAVPNADPLFCRLLDKYFHGERDLKTCELLRR
jgi:uncharacterized protein (DUF1810 family)